MAFSKTCFSKKGWTDKKPTREGLDQFSKKKSVTWTVEQIPGRNPFVFTAFYSSQNPQKMMSKMKQNLKWGKMQNDQNLKDKIRPGMEEYIKTENIEIHDAHWHELRLNLRSQQRCRARQKCNEEGRDKRSDESQQCMVMRLCLCAVLIRCLDAIFEWHIRCWVFDATCWDLESAARTGQSAVWNVKRWWKAWWFATNSSYGVLPRCYEDGLRGWSKGKVRDVRDVMEMYENAMVQGWIWRVYAGNVGCVAAWWYRGVVVVSQGGDKTIEKKQKNKIHSDVWARKQKQQQITQITWPKTHIQGESISDIRWLMSKISEDMKIRLIFFLWWDTFCVVSEWWDFFFRDNFPVRNCADSVDESKHGTWKHGEKHETRCVGLRFPAVGVVWMQRWDGFTTIRPPPSEGSAPEGKDVQKMKNEKREKRVFCLFYFVSLLWMRRRVFVCFVFVFVFSFSKKFCENCEDSERRGRCSVRILGVRTEGMRHP